jgi:hypothetical protein
MYYLEEKKMNEKEEKKTCPTCGWDMKYRVKNEEKYRVKNEDCCVPVVMR